MFLCSTYNAVTSFAIFLLEKRERERERERARELVALLLLPFDGMCLMCSSNGVVSSFPILLMGKRESWLFCLAFVFLMARDCCVVLSRGATGLSAVCGCCIS